MTNSAPLAKRHDFTGNDVATSFSYTKKISDQDHIKLVHTDTAGLENALADPPVVDVDYTVNGVGDAGGGSVDFPKAGSVYSTLATGEKLSIIYDFPTEQQLDTPNTGRVFNLDVENQLDYITNLISQLEELLDRSLKLPEGSTLTDITFPEGTSAANRALKGERWDAAGTALELITFTSGANIDPVAVKGDLIQGDTNGDAAKLAIGGTGAILSVVSGLLAYTAIGSTSAVLQVVAGVPTWATNPTILIPTIADFTNATHDHADVSGGGLLSLNLFCPNYRSGLNCKQASTTTITIEAGVIDVDGTLIIKTSDTTLNLTTDAHWIGGSSLQATATYGFVYVDASGNILMENSAPDESDTSGNTADILRYNDFGGATDYRCMGWFYMNATGSGELNAHEVSNLKDGDIENAVLVTEGTNDSITDTSFDNDITGMTSHFYTSGRGEVEIKCNVTFSSISGNTEVSTEIHDGSDIVTSEARHHDASAGSVNLLSLLAVHKEAYAQGSFTFDCKGKVNANSATVADKTMYIKEI